MASEKLERAKEAVQQSPAATLGYIKEYAGSGAGVFKAAGGVDALYDIYTIYKEWKKKKENNEPDTIGDKVTRTGKILLNLGSAALSGLLAAGAFGLTVVAAPILGVAAGAVSLAKNTVDLIGEYRKEAVLKGKLKVAEKALDDNKMDVERNLALFQDLSESQEEISDLKQRQEQIRENLQTLEKVKGSKLNLSTLVEARKAEIEDRIEANLAIDNLRSKIVQDIATLKSEDTSLSKTEKDVLKAQIEKNQAKLEKRVANNFDGIKFSEKKLEKYTKDLSKQNDGLKTLEKELISLKSIAGSDPLDIRAKEKMIEQVKENIEKIGGKVAKHEALIQYNEKLKELTGELEQAQKQRSALPEKYKKKPYNIIKGDKKENLIKLEQTFLDERIKSLTKSIQDIKDPEKRVQENAKLSEEEAQYEDPNADKAKTLEDSLGAELKKVTAELEDKKTKLNSKEDYAKLFLDPKEIQNPSLKMGEFLKNGFNASCEKAQIKHELKLNDIQKTKKKKSIFFGIAALAVGIMACIPPLQVVLAAAVIGIGVVAGVSAIYDYKKKSDQEKAIKIELKQLGDDSLKTAKEVGAKLDQLGPSKTAALALDSLLESGKKPQTKETVGAQALDASANTGVLHRQRASTDSSPPLRAIARDVRASTEPPSVIPVASTPRAKN